MAPPSFLATYIVLLLFTLKTSENLLTVHTLSSWRNRCYFFHDTQAASFLPAAVRVAGATLPLLRPVGTAPTAPQANAVLYF